ncbi:nucleotidyl transferase AbiEii/AbiGii toxin family protein [Leucobacter celer]|uniref:nucleotidyl transferase AbiEii/AbiGii toxin family protein n=1 Tax=Leucobacter celer TaxID=668625 RepID=UPI0006A77926|nr:nucleotidyl transferase AbiEii/AbiGii toxin family protein [Leucobacter celer]
MNSAGEATYPDGRALRQAVKAAAAVGGPPEMITERMQRFWFDRFLCRVFIRDEDAAWTLKGGMGLLARVQDARSTQDIDFTVTGRDLSAAVAELARMASADLGDHMVFEERRAPTEVVGQGKNVTGKRMYFVGRCGGHEVTRFHVDVVIAPAPIGDISVIRPQHRADLNRDLPVSDYRVFPVEDHLAEKVAAMLAHVRGDENTRVKDLVDIVILSRTQSVDRRKLREALEVTFLRAGVTIPTEVTVPEKWRAMFPATAAGSLVDGISFDAALEQARDYLTPVLAPNHGEHQAAQEQPRTASDRWPPGGPLFQPKQPGAGSIGSDPPRGPQY